MFLVGIDNGVTGGLCILPDMTGGSPVAMIPMPVQVTKKGREVDVLAVREWLGAFGPWSMMRVIIEEPGGSKSASAAASMAHSFGALRGAFAWGGIPVIRITPQRWQKDILGKCADTKAAALTKARELWPSETWLASARCRVANDGLVDSALIAEFARRNRL
jgi:hypothetical protein